MIWTCITVRITQNETEGLDFSVFSKMGHSHYSSSARLMIVAEILEKSQKVDSGVHHLHLCWLRWPPGQRFYHQEKWQEYHFPFNTQRYSQIQECQQSFFSFKAYITRWCVKNIANANSIAQFHTMRSLLGYYPWDIKTQVQICQYTFCSYSNKTLALHKLHANYQSSTLWAIKMKNNSPKSCTSHKDNGFTWLEGHICLLLGLWCRSYTGAAGYFDRCCHFHSRHLKRWPGRQNIICHAWDRYSNTASDMVGFAIYLCFGCILLQRVQNWL